MKHAKPARRRSAAGITLERFAGAKQSRFDKKAKAEKKAALKAKRVNKYRNLKRKILGLEHSSEHASPDGQNAEQPGERDIDMRRVRSRAGPAPGDVDDVSKDLTDEESLSGAEQDSKGANDDAGGLNRQSQHRNGAAGRSADNEPRPKKRRKQKKPPSQIQRLAKRVQTEKDAKQEEAARKAMEQEERQKQVLEAERLRKKRRELFLKKTKRGQPVMKHRIEGLLGKLQADQ